MGADWEEAAGGTQQLDDALAPKIGHKNLVNRATKKGLVRHSHVSFSNARKDRCFSFSAISQG
jgi:hypothetical protein